MIKQREKVDKPRSTSQYVNARNGKVIHSDTCSPAFANSDMDFKGTK